MFSINGSNHSFRIEIDIDTEFLIEKFHAIIGTVDDLLYHKVKLLRRQILKL